MLVDMSQFCAHLAALITILVAAALISMLITLTRKATEITFSIAGGRILVPCRFSFGKTLVTVGVAGGVVGVVLSLANSAAQIAGGIAGVIINVTYLTNKTAIAAVRIAIVFEIVGLGSPSGSTNIALTVARIGIKVRRGWTNKFALVAVKIAFIGISMRGWHTCLAAGITISITGIIVCVPCPGGYKSAEGAFALAGVFYVMRYVGADKSAVFTLRVAGCFKDM